MGNKIITALILAALGEFCLFGFIASLEPGTHSTFRIGFSLLALTFFAGAIRLGFSASGLQRVVQIWGGVGLFLGACVAFALVFGTFMVGPRAEALGAMVGVVYGVLVAPIGAAIGGASGAWIGSKLRSRKTQQGQVTSD